MINFFQTKGTLRVVLGRGYISSYELNRFKAGDVMLVKDRLCGEHASLYFNSQHMGRGDIIFIENSIGFRITELTTEVPALSFPGTSAALGEILDTVFTVCERECSFEDIQNTQVYSVIAFGPEEYRTPLYKSISVYCGGIKTAEGTVIVNDENWGIKAEKTIGLGGANLPVRTTVNPGLSLHPKQYDFSRPDRFTKEQIDSAADIHKRFAKNLNLSQLSSFKVSVDSADQLTWGEFIDDSKKNAITYSRCVIAGNPGRPVLKSREHTGSGNKFFLPSENFDPSKVEELQEMFKTEAEANISAVPMGVICIVFQGEKAAALAEDSEAFVQQLESSWRDRIAVGISVIEQRDSINEDFLRPHWDMILLVTLKLDKNNYIKLVYPYINLQKILHLLG